MKVAEKSTDRVAEVHISVEGKAKELEEYGQYIDATDNAICCYVPVEEGHKVKIGAYFSGTTLTVAYDAVVDGIHRKAGSSTSKTVCHSRKKNLGLNSFLYKINDDIIDTKMVVGSISKIKAIQGLGPETIGTIELRVYITRQLGISHAPRIIEKYSNSKSHIEDEPSRVATYALVPPSYYMTFETDVALLETFKANREKRRMDALRPGTEPWAIFRFHYRSKAAILKEKLDVTWDPNKKSKAEPHQLLLEAVPPLLVGSKLLKEDGDNFTRASSLTPAPLTPIISAQTERPIQAPVTPAKEVPRFDPLLIPASKRSSSTDPTISAAPDTEPTADSVSDMNESLRSHILSKFISKPVSNSINGSSSDAGSIDISSSTTNHTGNKTEELRKKTAAPSSPMVMIPKQLNNGGRPATSTAYKIVDKEQSEDDDMITVKSATQISSFIKNKIDPSKQAAKRSTTPSQQTVKKAPQQDAAASAKSTSIGTKDKPAQEKPPNHTPPVIPTKRTADPTHSTSPEIKRPKPTPAPPRPSPSTTIPQVPSTPATPRSTGIEREIARKRKELETLRLQRAERAKKQEELDKKMEPYMQRMTEELERLDREMNEEAAAAAEEEERWNVGMEMLAEFEEGGGNE